MDHFFIKSPRNIFLVSILGFLIIVIAGINVYVYAKNVKVTDFYSQHSGTLTTELDTQ